MKQSRRQIVRTAGILAVAPLYVPWKAFGANEQLSFGMIGTGSRGRALQKAFQNLDARCAAVCDVYEPYMLTSQELAGPGTKTYGDYRALLEDRSLDFVVIATPDHHHCPMLLDSLAVAKDVYIEKPLSHTLEENERMVKAVGVSKQIVQVGMQRRSMAYIYKAKKLVDEGILGQISIVNAAWNWHFAMPLSNAPLEGKLDWERFQGPAPRRPLEPMRFRWWRAFWDYSGGNMTDQGTHLMDVVQWMTDSGPPLSAMADGHVALQMESEVPNVFSAVFRYPNFMATWTLNYRTSYNQDWSIQFIGEKAAMRMDRRGYRIYKVEGETPEPWSQSGKTELLIEEPETRTPEAHQRNFLDCVRSRRDPNCTVEIAAAAVTGPHMANISLRERRIVVKT